MCVSQPFQGKAVRKKLERMVVIRCMLLQEQSGNKITDHIY